MSRVTLDLGGLNALRAALKAGSKLRAHVGLFRSKSVRTARPGSWSEKIDNPTLGLVHEFGSAEHNIPARSFLLMPLMQRLQKRINQIGRGVWAGIINQRGLGHGLAVLGVQGEIVVQEAFDSGGFGQWAPNKPATIRRKKSAKPLIDTAQMRKAVSSRVVDGGAQ